MENKNLISRFFNDVVNGNNQSVIDEIVHPEYTNYGFPIEVKGTEAMKQITGMMFSGFPDLKITLEGTVSEGTSIATRGFWEGTHRGDFMGIAPTGKKVKVNYIDVWNIKNGKLHENWVQMDFAGLMQQLNS